MGQLKGEGFGVIGTTALGVIFATVFLTMAVQSGDALAGGTEAEAEEDFDKIISKLNTICQTPRKAGEVVLDMKEGQRIEFTNTESGSNVENRAKLIGKDGNELKDDNIRECSQANIKVEERTYSRSVTVKMREKTGEDLIEMTI